VAFSPTIQLPTLMSDHRDRSATACALAVAALAGTIAAVADGGLASANSPAAPLGVLPPPEPPPFLLRDVSPEDAVAMNARIPFSSEENVPAKPFRLVGDDEARDRASDCLSLAIYYEAGNQDEAAQQAVAQVVLNRVRHPAFPASVCGVVFQGYERKTGCQFTFTCDGSLLRAPDSRIWARAETVAAAALDGAVFKPVGLATHYHANYVVPYWATSLEKNAQVGVHIFYRWPGAWGTPAAFLRKYAGNEPDPATLRGAAVEQARWDKGLISPDGGAQVAVDSRLELLSVVQLLANGASDLPPADHRYLRDVDAYFASSKNHLAVQLFKQLSEADPNFGPTTARVLLDYSAAPELTPGANSGSVDKKTEDFIEALRDFARSSEFDRFFAGHKPFYSAAISRTERQVGMARAYWEAYTGAQLGSQPVLLSSTVASAPRACFASSDPVILSLATFAHASDADIFLTLEGTDGALARSRSSPAKPELDSGSNEQIIRAVFARIVALTDGDAASRAYVTAEVHRGYTMVPVLEKQLRDYELHRDRFSTWSEALSVPRPAGERRALARPEDRSHRSCAPTVAAATDQEPSSSKLLASR
jgi:spore germination cell wall hydrolase CwlJ-like protein